MTSRFLLAAAVLFAFSCSSDDGAKTKPGPDPDPDTGAETTGPAGTNGFQLTGQEGALMVLKSARSFQADESYSVTGLFADDLQGVITPNWCVDGRACITAFPGEGFQATFETDIWDAESSVYNWLGNDISVGELKMPFINDFERGLAYYSVSLPQLPQESPVVIQLDGEWGTFEIDDFALPGAFDIQSPDPSVPVGLTGIIELRWSPVFEGKLYVRFEGAGVNRIYHLENTGEYDLDTSELGSFDPEDVQMFFGLWIERTIEVNGNNLTAFGVWEQPYQGTDCSYPIGTFAGGGGAPVGPDMRPEWITMGFDGVIDQGRFWDYKNDVANDGVAETFTSAVFFNLYEADPINPAQVGPHLCQVVYDASTNVSATYTSTTGQIYDAFDVNLSNGDSDCNSLDAGVWGFTDVRDVLESNQYDWGFGVGEVQNILPNLQVKYDPDWAIWEPLLLGGYVSFDGNIAWEWDEVHVFPMTECAVVEPMKTETEAPTAGPVFVANYNAIPLFAFPFTP